MLVSLGVSEGCTVSEASTYEHDSVLGVCGVCAC